MSYVPSRRRGQAAADTALDAAVAQANQFADVVNAYDPSAAVLRLFALHHDWLAHDAALLARRLAGVAGPVGIMLGHSRDPLSNPAAVHGLIEIVTALPDVALLRTDLDGLGALAWGASFTSIGVDTNTQSFVRYRQRGSAPPDRLPNETGGGRCCYIPFTGCRKMRMGGPPRPRTISHRFPPHSKESATPATSDPS